MSRLEVLDATVSEQRARWLDLWDSWPDREVLAHPDYVRLFATSAERPICAAYRADKGTILLPMLLRPVASERWAADDELSVDAVTPYGYGGAFAWNVGPQAVENFWDAFDAWAEREHMVTLFARLSLFPEQIAPFRGTIEERFGNVVRDLTSDGESIWRDYAHKVRKNVNKARRAGLVVERDEVGARLDAFLDIYYHTMDRRSAAELYYFPREFFERIVRDLRGQFAFFHVLYERRVVSTELVLVSDHRLYSFLGGTRAEAFDLRPNDLLKHEVIEWGRSVGKRAFVLGGSGRPDGILRYKLGFAPGGERPFFVGFRVLDKPGCARLVQQRRQWERVRGAAWDPSEGFFPPYRG